MAAIGVFDSGVGGLTVVRALRAALPAADVLYLGDTARVPYGSKSPRTVERYSLACQRFLLDRGVGMVLIACNTASANALSALTAASPVPVIGAVGPGAAAAAHATRNHQIGVIGTLATVRSSAYVQAIAALEPAAVVHSLACPMLVPLAEEGWVDGDIARAVCERYLRALFEQAPDIDTLVLGCTHYPLLSDTLAEVAATIAGRDITIVDSATSMAAVAKELASDATANATGKLSLCATDATRLDELAPRFLGEPAVDFELVDL